MTILRDPGGYLWLASLLAFLLAVGTGGTGDLTFAAAAGMLGVLLFGVFAQDRYGLVTDIAIAVLLVMAGWALLFFPQPVLSYWAMLVAHWLGAWMLVARLSARARWGSGLARVQSLLPPLIFGVTLLFLWQAVARALAVPRVILPVPGEIGARFAGSLDILWVDLVQTFGKGALSGYAIGVGAAFVFALLVDRVDFLRRGLLPVGNFLSALPIIGTAPIFVMWFGFDWPSKAAVVVAMVFFPMLVNTVQGLATADKMQRDLMHTYSASWVQTLIKLRLPAAMPFVFNGLKICATLALIGAIVAEFFGSPTRGMGFRISTEVGRLQLDLVWAEITMAALAGSAFYGFWALIERRVTFWHPSQRGF